MGIWPARAKEDAHAVTLAKLAPTSRDCLSDLNRALRKMRTISFKSIGKEVTETEGTRYLVYYQLYDPATDFIYQRKDWIKLGTPFASVKNSDDGAISQSNRVNRDGGFVCLLDDRTALKHIDSIAFTLYVEISGSTFTRG